MTIDSLSLVVFMGIPSAVTGLCFWTIQRSIVKRDEKRDKQEEARKKNELLLIKGVGAAIALGEATAESIKRLDSACNGKMSKALDYAQTVKHEQKDFLSEQGVSNFL